MSQHNKAFPAGRCLYVDTMLGSDTDFLCIMRAGLLINCTVARAHMSLASQLSGSKEITCSGRLCSQGSAPNVPYMPGGSQVR